ncbi:MAG: hypothetical protein JWO03_1185 [Bacteroidetes bacterium]|nr:hypothetical protein [Bacteroidota bacterium]
MTTIWLGFILLEKSLLKPHFSNPTNIFQMSTFKTILVALLIAPVATAFAGDCNPLSGELRIGQNDADYPTIAAAVSALKCGGVNGPVTFLLEDGKYSERIDLSAISGVSAQNTVTFESAKGNNSDVVLSSTSPDVNYTVGLNNTSYVSFENLTIENRSGNTGNAVKLDGSARNIKFKNVVFNGNEKPATGANSAVIYSTSNEAKSSIIFEDCEVNNGSVGLYKGGSASADTRTSITGTLFFNQYESAITLTNEASPVISNNVVSTVSNYKTYKAISLDKVGGNMIVSNNVVNAVNGSYGLAMNNCEGTASNLGSVTNNSLNVGGSGAMYGLYLTGSTDNVVFNFNRVKLTPTVKNAPTQAYYKNSGTGANINLLNNIFFDLNTGGYTILGNTYKDFFNQLPSQSNSALSVSANGIMIEKVTPAN